MSEDSNCILQLSPKTSAMTLAQTVATPQDMHFPMSAIDFHQTTNKSLHSHRYPVAPISNFNGINVSKKELSVIQKQVWWNVVFQTYILCMCVCVCVFFLFFLLCEVSSLHHSFVWFACLLCRCIKTDTCFGKRHCLDSNKKKTKRLDMCVFKGITSYTRLPQRST